VLSVKLAEVLDARVGDLLTIEVLDGRRAVERLPVTGSVEEYMGTAAYMEIGALRTLAGEGATLSGAFLKVDDAYTDALYDRLKATPAVAGVSLKGTAIESSRRPSPRPFTS
jgi:putative ABC transport system permease protein